MEATSVLNTGFGFWQPLLWLAAFVLVLLIALLIRSMGSRQYQQGTDQTKPFLSGCDEPDPAAVHVRASNLYWGFTETLKGYYEKVVAWHTGNVVDYLLWFFGVLVITLIIGLVL